VADETTVETSCWRPRSKPQDDSKSRSDTLTRHRGFGVRTRVPIAPWTIVWVGVALVLALGAGIAPPTASRVTSEPRNDYAFRSILTTQPALAAGTPRPSAIGGVPADATMTMPVSRPPIRQTMKSEVLSARQGPSLSGQATWYRWRVGEAAAGPALRKALGPNWRGRWVRVCAGDACVRVQLTDWCACQPMTRLVDLDGRSFARLASLSRGVVAVVVHRN